MPYRVNLKSSQVAKQGNLWGVCHEGRFFKALTMDSAELDSSLIIDCTIFVYVAEYKHPGYILPGTIRISKHQKETKKKLKRNHE